MRCNLVVVVMICLIINTFTVSSLHIQQSRIFQRTMLGISMNQVRGNDVVTTKTFAASNSCNPVATTAKVGLQTFSSIPNSCHFSPMERVILTANGNLQRMLSAYFDAPISVTVLLSQQRDDKPHIFDREVLLSLQDPENVHQTKLLCYIKGEISVFNQSILSEIISGNIGVGQLFSKLQIQPYFTLHNAGKHLIHNNIACESASQFQSIFSDVDFHLASNHSNNENGIDKAMLWRDYSLNSVQFSCRFIELFAPNFLL